MKTCHLFITQNLKPCPQLTYDSALLRVWFARVWREKRQRIANCCQVLNFWVLNRVKGINRVINKNSCNIKKCTGFVFQPEELTLKMSQVQRRLQSEANWIKGNAQSKLKKSFLVVHGCILILWWVSYSITQCRFAQKYVQCSGIYCYFGTQS